MERIGVRELRQHASEWLRRVAAGEQFEVTVRGRPVGRLVPLSQPPAGVAGLVAAGRLRPAEARVEDSEPLPAIAPTATQLLEELRAGER